MTGNPYAQASVVSTDTEAMQLPTLGVSGQLDVSGSAAGASASVQVTGVLIVLLVVALVVMARSWPVVG